MHRLKIHNGRVITPAGVIGNGSVLVEDGLIIGVESSDVEFENALSIDAEGRYISPGFIDIHIHGGGGFDFMDETEEAFIGIAETHARFGTTAMVPTTLSATKEAIIKALEIFERVRDRNPSGSQLLGVHIEGPYFAMNQRGAQDPRYIRDPDPLEYQEIIDHYKGLVRWSVAPELNGALEMGIALRAKGILAAIAHTDAVYEDVVKAVECGYTLATHLYSAMSGVTRKNAFRYAGVIESSLLMDEIDVELIGDGIHLPAPLLKLVYKVKGRDKIALITDAMRGAAMPEGESMLGNLHSGLKVIIEDGVAKLPDRTSFAGSVATADRLVRTMHRLGEVSIADAVYMAATTPARIMGVNDRKGSLEAGKDADLVIFDDDVNIYKTIIKGGIVYEKSVQG
ncbi:MAG TPA: N-acetylglucosamine-6-phosphate deacetylase [Chitinophagaceae bacterium]|nr:N-acetylglucosamine-6-phosphate deacetylase [Chitinophagaceae bacterium]